MSRKYWSITPLITLFLRNFISTWYPSNSDALHCSIYVRYPVPEPYHRNSFNPAGIPSVAMCTINYPQCICYENMMRKVIQKNNLKMWHTDLIPWVFQQADERKLIVCKRHKWKNVELLPLGGTLSHERISLLADIIWTLLIVLFDRRRCC